MSDALAKGIVEAFQAQGFDDQGWCRAEVLSEGENLRTWIACGRHGEMGYMASNLEVREDPRLLHESAELVIMGVVGLGPLESGDRAFARFACHQDYHGVLKAALKRILAQLSREFGVRGRVFVDTAPAMEKVLAARCGLGWLGRNTLFYHRTLGSHVLLGGLTIDQVPEEGFLDMLPSRCGGCRICLDACLGGALSGTGLDARRCVSYLTIEKKSELSPAEEEVLANQSFIFGCDRCQEVCPRNQHLGTPRGEMFGSRVFSGREGEPGPRTAEEFRERFLGTPVMRSGPERLARVSGLVRGNLGRGLSGSNGLSGD